jgi:hypothetical protein
VLVTQFESPQYFADTPQSELTDRLPPYLLRQGSSPSATRSPNRGCWNALVVPAKVTGIETGGSLLTIVDDNAEVFFTGPFFTPACWQRAALESGECTLYYGPTKLDPASCDFPTRNRLLEDAARDGRLLAARLPCMDRTTAGRCCQIEQPAYWPYEINVQRKAWGPVGSSVAAASECGWASACWPLSPARRDAANYGEGGEAV